MNEDQDWGFLALGYLLALMFIYIGVTGGGSVFGEQPLLIRFLDVLLGLVMMAGLTLGIKEAMQDE